MSAAAGVSVHLPLARCYQANAHPGHDWVIKSGRGSQQSYCPGQPCDGSVPLKAAPCPVVTAHHRHAWDAADGLLAYTELRWCLGDRVLHGQPEAVMAGMGDRARPDSLDGAAVLSMGTGTAADLALAAQRCSKAGDHAGHAWRGTGTQGAWVYCSGLGASGIHPPTQRCTLLGTREHHGHIWEHLGQRRWCHGDALDQPAPDPPLTEISTVSLDVEPCSVTPVHGGHSWRSPARFGTRAWCTGLGTARNQVPQVAACMVSSSHIRHVWLNTGEWRWCYGLGDGPQPELRTETAAPDMDVRACWQDGVHTGHAWRPVTPDGAPADPAWCTGLPAESAREGGALLQEACPVTSSHIRHVWSTPRGYSWCYGHGAVLKDRNTRPDISRTGANALLKFSSEAEAERFRRWWLDHGAAAWADQGDSLRHYKIAGKD